MKKASTVLLLLVLVAVSTLSLAGTARGEEMKMVGTVSEIRMAADGKSATAVLKDTKSGESVPIEVTDELTLDKLKDKRIVEGDEIRCKFDRQDGKNSSRIFRKTAGC